MAVEKKKVDVPEVATGSVEERLALLEKQLASVIEALVNSGGHVQASLRQVGLTK